MQQAKGRPPRKGVLRTRPKRPRAREKVRVSPCVITHVTAPLQDGEEMGRACESLRGVVQGMRMGAISGCRQATHSRGDMGGSSFESSACSCRECHCID